MKVDVLKCPHHGSDRNVDNDYFERILADHYVISADGKHGNPDVPTLEMISAARPDDDFTIHFTYQLDDFADQKVAKEIKAFLAKEKKKGRKYEVVFRDKNEPSIRIAL
jgi:beta-lactamase superfamily II metal-dependent hydrolase